MMNFIRKLFGKAKPQKGLDEATLLEAGVCPNCWGHQEYEDQYIDYVEDQTKSNINHDKSNQKAFIQQFVETNVTGIHLKREGDQLSCPKCQGKYKHVNSKAN